MSELKIEDIRVGSLVENQGGYHFISSVYSPSPREPEYMSDVPLVDLIDGGIRTVRLDECKGIPITKVDVSKVKNLELRESSTKRAYWSHLGNPLIPIDYLHELQDIYRLIVGVELEVTTELFKQV